MKLMSLLSYLRWIDRMLKYLDIISELLDSNPQIVTDYKEGKDRVIGYLVGQVNKVTNGNANPKIVHKLIIQEIKRR